MRPGTITAIAPQKRDRERVNVHVDGQYAFSLALLAAAGLRVGQELTAEDIAGLQRDDSYEKAKQSAIGLISRRPRSTTEVRRHLHSKGIDETVIEQVVSRLNELELLNDQAFADYWIEQRESFRPRSPMALRQELLAKGVSREVIDDAVAEVDEIDAARRAAASQAARWQDLERERFVQKMAGYLQRRGFRYSVIRQITEEMWPG